MSIKRKVLGTRIDEAIEASAHAIQRAADRLVQSYYDGLEDLRREKELEYVKLNLRARTKGNSLEIAWFNRHTKGGVKGFENIPKPRGRSDYNLTVLRGNGLPGMETLIDRTEETARMLREASKRLVEAGTALSVMQARLIATPPEIIAAINNTGSPTEPIAAKQQFLDLDLDRL